MYNFVIALTTLYECQCLHTLVFLKNYLRNHISFKRYYQSKDFVPEMAVDTGKKKTIKAKDEKKDDTKKSKNKKGNNATILDNYNLINTDDKILASFKMELSPTLDGLTREIYKKFDHKIKIEPKLETPATAINGNFKLIFPKKIAIYTN